MKQWQINVRTIVHETLLELAAEGMYVYIMPKITELTLCNYALTLMVDRINSHIKHQTVVIVNHLNIHTLYIHAYINAYIRACTLHTFIHKHAVNAYQYAYYVYVHIYTHVFTYMHTYIHTCIHACIHT